MDYSYTDDYSNDLDHNGMNSSYPQFESFQHNLFTNILWFILYSATVLITVGGNVLVIWTIYANQVMKSCTNYLIVSVAVTDIIYNVFRALPTVFMFTTQRFPFGGAFYVAHEFMLPLSIFVTPYTLIAIALVQYRIIIYPYQRQYTINDGLKMLSVLWVVGAVLSFPFVFRSTFSYIVHYRHFYRVYDIMIIVLGFFLPSIGLIILYRRIWTRLQPDVVQSEKREILNMNIVAAIVYMAGWIIINVFLVMELCGLFWSDNIYLITIWLTYCSGMLKPFVYVKMSQELRCNVKKTFPFMPIGPIRVEVI